jgi:hypothetical protein
MTLKPCGYLLPRWLGSVGRLINDNYSAVSGVAPHFGIAASDKVEDEHLSFAHLANVTETSYGLVWRGIHALADKRRAASLDDSIITKFPMR